MDEVCLGCGAKPVVPEQVMCSFCGNSQQACYGLVSGPCVHVCSECVVGIVEKFSEQLSCGPEEVYGRLCSEHEAIHAQNIGEIAAKMFRDEVDESQKE
jgi:hypothetical protein